MDYKTVAANILKNVGGAEKCYGFNTLFYKIKICP